MPAYRLIEFNDRNFQRQHGAGRVRVVSGTDGSGYSRADGLPGVYHPALGVVDRYRGVSHVHGYLHPHELVPVHRRAVALVGVSVSRLPAQMPPHVIVIVHLHRVQGPHYPLVGIIVAQLITAEDLRVVLQNFYGDFFRILRIALHCPQGSVPVGNKVPGSGVKRFRFHDVGDGRGFIVNANVPRLGGGGGGVESR